MEKENINHIVFIKPNNEDGALVHRMLLTTSCPFAVEHAAVGEEVKLLILIGAPEPVAVRGRKSILEFFKTLVVKKGGRENRRRML